MSQAIVNALEHEHKATQEDLELQINVARSAIRAFLVSRFDYVHSVAIERTACLIKIKDMEDKAGLEIRLSDKNQSDPREPIFESDLRYSLVMSKTDLDVLNYLELIGYIATQYRDNLEFKHVLHENMQHVKDFCSKEMEAHCALTKYNAEIEQKYEAFFEVVCDVSEDRTKIVQGINTQQLLDIINKYDIEYEISQDPNYSAQWPEINFVGTKDQLFHIFKLMDPYDRTDKELRDLTNIWDGSDDGLWEFMG